MALALVALACAALSIGAVVDRASGFQGWIPRLLTQALAWFIEPGLTVWWLTLGGAFQGFPHSFAGYAVTIGANVALWVLAIVLIWSIFRWLRSRWYKQASDARRP